MRTTAGRQADSGEELLRRMAARRRRDNAIVAVIAVLAVLGGGRTILGWFADKPVAKSPDTMSTAIIGHARLAESFAEEFVVTYLSASSGQQERLGEYVGGGQQINLPATGRQVSDPIVVFTSRNLSTDAFDVWSVTVSVRVAKTGAGASGNREYYRVAVSVAADGRRRALAVPAAVEPPGRGIDLVLGYQNPCGAESPLAQVASGFLSAYLTGSGDIARYTVPNSGIAALRPAPFTSAETTTVSSDDAGCGVGGSNARVLVTVNPKTASGAAPTLAYPLTMIQTAGQWQVEYLDSMPELREPMTVVAANEGSGGAPTSTATSAPSSAVSIPPATQN
ncbi:conjugal transfer protein [Nocardia pseudovaccinii]|uniref:conjugal transfer protein n=1 Tax=Nocardia pseudovaccinii TaxID=189540 RepID=UPI001FDFE62B|nr:conjugal transfer protein [Nocardia pseudovaccinii]